MKHELAASSDSKKAEGEAKTIVDLKLQLVKKTDEFSAVVAENNTLKKENAELKKELDNLKKEAVKQDAVWNTTLKKLMK